MSGEDVTFMKIMEDGVKMVNKHYQIPLPFRNSNIQLPNNRYQAWQRLSSLQKSFNKNKEFENAYECPTTVQKRRSGSNGGHRSNVSSGKGP